ncbi:SDR family NAD(P)-dependent oxidoreductase, partial [Xanthovirga aplysinae]|uniref:SDR family NAD(P)-dependent oxidoreductase n=1 Tax=Xanthovirga aplysinae TaxID=2529853 RepID=UPI0012BC1346
VTGASNGMGKGVAKVLAGLEQVNEIILLCRSEELGLSTVKELQNLSENLKVSLLLCDLTKLEDVRKVIEEVKNQHNFLDGLFINAGMGYAPLRLQTQDGMDGHFQVNYLSQFMLTLNLLELLENSQKGGRVVFNVTEYGKIIWEDMQLTSKWGYVKAIYQAMAAKRMFFTQLHNLYSQIENRNVSFLGFRVHKTVWTNQINIIPLWMRLIALLSKFFGAFISIEECGQVMAPLFLEIQEESQKKSGKLITWKKNSFVEMKQKNTTLNQGQLDKLWAISLDLCKDEKTHEIGDRLLLDAKQKLNQMS